MAAAHKTCKFFLYILIALFTIGSCSGTLLEGDARNAGLVDILTVRDGSVLSEGDLFHLNLYFDEEFAQPSEIHIELQGIDGSILDTFDLEYSDNLEPYQLSALSDGSYLLAILVREEDGEIIGEKKVPFFYTDELYAIEQITTYPPSIEYGSEILINGVFSVPEGADPYVRWIFDGELITQGPLSMTGDLLQWKVPDKPGVYTLSAELFPFSPVSGSRSFNFSAPYKKPGSVFAVRNLEPGITELSPESMYPYLFHFRGNFRNHGYDDQLAVEIEGAPVLSVEDGIFGYSFDPSSGLEFNKNLFKIDNLSNFEYIIQLKGIFAAEEDPADLLSGGELFHLFRKEGGFGLRIGYEEYSVEKESGYSFLGIHISQEDGRFRLDWYDEGEIILSESVDASVIASLAESDEKTRLGFGFRGILDEFGIISNAEGFRGFNQFVQAMQMKYGTSLILAEGFDRSSLPSVDSQLSVEGDAVLRGSTLDLSETGLLQGKGFSLPPNGIAVIFGAALDDFSELTVTYSDGETVQIPLTWNEGFFTAAVEYPRSDGEEALYQDEVKIDFQLEGPGEIKNLVLLNEANENL